MPRRMCKFVECRSFRVDFEGVVVSLEDVLEGKKAGNNCGYAILRPQMWDVVTDREV